MKGNPESRKWILIINNPKEAGLDHDTIKELLMRFQPNYFCLADEIASTGTYHTHIHIYSTSPIRFSTLKRRFPTAHIEKAYASVAENRMYILKGDKWADTTRADTSVVGTFEEYGQLPAGRAETAPEQSKLIQDLRDGKSIMDIIEDNPKFIFRIREMEVLRQTILSEKYSKITRDLTVTYLFGSTGTGKTWGIFNKYDPRDICRITNYGTKNGIKFDSYYCQGTLVFEEFHSQIPIADMLNYLDKYPLTLPARYSDRQACYTQVFLTSNAALDEQYPDIQRNQLETWCAFNRRINNVVEFLPDGSRIVHKGVNPFD